MSKAAAISSDSAKARLIALPLFVIAVVVSLICSGCAGYQLGPTNGKPAGTQSIQVNPFQDKTLEPRLTDYVNNAIRKRVQADGTFKLDTQDDGDIIVNGVITIFHRSELTFSPADSQTPRDYTLTMTAEITAIERGSGKVIFKGPVHGRTTIRIGADQTSSERQAVPLLAEDLARNTVSALAEGTW